jgi:hypothetical protein
VPAFPKLTGAINGEVVGVQCEVSNPFAESFIVNGKLEDGEVVRSGEHTFSNLLVGKEYTLNFTGVRQLQAFVSGSERSLGSDPVAFEGLMLTANRRFEVLGEEVTGSGDNPPRNTFTSSVFGSEFLL